MNTHKSIIELVCTAVIFFMEHTNIKFNAYHVQKRIQQYDGIEVSKNTISNYISRLYQAGALSRETNPNNGAKNKLDHREVYVYTVNTYLVDSDSHAFLVQSIRRLQRNTTVKHRKNKRTNRIARIDTLQKALKRKTAVIKELQQQLANQGVVVSTQEAVIDNQRAIVRDLNRNRSMSAEVLPAGTTDIAFKCVTRVINARLSLEISVDTPEYSHTIKKSEKM